MCSEVLTDEDLQKIEQNVSVCVIATHWNFLSLAWIGDVLLHHNQTHGWLLKKLWVYLWYFSPKYTPPHTSHAGSLDIALHMNNQQTTSSIKNWPRCIQSQALHRTHFGQNSSSLAVLGWPTAISCTECSQVAGLIQSSVETPRKCHVFVQLSFV